jgi:hypothetical protein
MTEPNQPGTHVEASARGYETSDARLRPILAFGAGLTVFALVVLLVIAWMFHAFLRREVRLDPPPSPVAASRAQPPEPRLQSAPAQDLEAVRAAEDALLNSYGWADRQAGHVRIPIDRAMELLSERGLPVRGEPRTKK